MARRGQREDAAASAAYIVRGEDASLVGQQARDLIRSLAGEYDVSTVVEELGGQDGDEVDVGVVVDGLTTPPFLTDRRIVVVRDAGRLNAADAARIVACLADPVPGVVLVLVAGGGTVPAALMKSIEGTGGAVDTAVGSGRARTDWLRERLGGGPVRLDARAAARLGDHLGEDMSRVRGLLDMLAAAYGEGSSIDVDRLEPFLGDVGTVAPWTLTDAIDAGETAEALAALDRMFGAVRWHPLAVLSLLHRHYQAMLRLDGSGITTPDEAARHLGLRSAYPARKALDQTKKLGSARIGRAVMLLAEADLDLRGLSALPDETVLQVLVGRLSRLATPRPTPARRPAPQATARRRR